MKIVHDMTKAAGTSQLTPPQQAGDIPWPASDVAWHYMEDFKALHGITKMSYSTGDRSLLSLDFKSPNHAAMADSVLKDTIFGVRLVMTVNGEAADPNAPIDDWATRGDNLARVVAAMPGVMSQRWNGTTAYFTADTNERRAHLEDIVNGRLGGSWTLWAPKCTGSGCPVLPKHDLQHKPLPI